LGAERLRLPARITNYESRITNHKSRTINSSQERPSVTQNEQWQSKRAQSRPKQAKAVDNTKNLRGGSAIEHSHQSGCKEIETDCAESSDATFVGPALEPPVASV